MATAKTGDEQEPQFRSHVKETPLDQRKLPEGKWEKNQKMHMKNTENDQWDWVVTIKEVVYDADLKRHFYKVVDENLVEWKDIVAEKNLKPATAS